MKNENKTVRNLILIVAGVLGFLGAINPLSWNSLLIFLFLLVISYVIYQSKDYQNELIGIIIKKGGVSLLAGASAGFGFYLVTRLIPGLSIGLPLLPNAISDELRFFIVVLVAPFVEEIFFRGAVLGFLRDVMKTKNYLIPIIIQAGIFSLFHLGAYITGFYSLPNVSTGILAFSSNISAFISAFVFGTLAGILAVRTKSLVTTIIFHLIVNLVIFTSLTLLIA